MTRFVLWLAPKLDVLLKPFGLWMVLSFELDGEPGETDSVLHIRGASIQRRPCLDRAVWDVKHRNIGT